MRRLLALLTFLALASTAVAQRTDIVQMPNGERLTGEIKYVERGRLSYSVSHMHRLSIDWSQVRRVESEHFFDFELSNSSRLFGSIDEGDEDGAMIIVTDTARIPVRIADVVRIEPLRSSFWGRMKGSSIDLGLDFTRVNLQRQWNLTTKLKYRTKRWLLTFDGDSYLNIQEDRADSKRNNASLTPQRFLSKGYSVFATVKAEQNDELQLELRGTAVVGASRFFVQTNNVSFQSALGVAATEEKFRETDRTTNLEGLVSADFSWFKFIVPKIDFRVDAFVYPSISSFGRVRGNLSSAIMWEPISDVRFGLNGFFVFDTDPAEGASKIDYGAFSSIGVTI